MDILMSKIKCVADRSYNAGEDRHLLETIKFRLDKKLTPLLQPIALQKLDNDTEFDYVVDDGRRRFLALSKLGMTQLIVGQDAVVIDGDSEVNAYVGNQHTNLSLQEEITKLYSIRERYGTLDALAESVGHSKTWVARRLNLINLSDLWKKAMQEKTFGYMTISHYETIATFPPEIQNDIFDYIRSVSGKDFKSASIRNFSETLYEKFATVLSSLPWEEKGCGTCPACKERDENGSLFASMLEDARCMNREYIQKKRKEYASELAAQNPEAVLVCESYPTNESDNDEADPVLNPDEWKEADEQHGTPAIIANGSKAGKKIYIQKTKTTEGKVKQEKTLAERKEIKAKQRQRKAVDKFITHLKAMEYTIPDRNIIFALIACKGVGAVCGGYKDCQLKEPSKIKSYSKISARTDLDTLVWQKLLENLTGELSYGQSGPYDVCWSEAKLLAEMIDFDLAKALEEATAELPDPKSWAALEKKEAKEQKAA